MPSLDTIAATIQEVATPGAKPKEVITAVRLRHPGASKKDVVRAAFFALTGGLDDPEKAKRLHDLAIEGRRAGEPESEVVPRPRKTKRKKSEGQGSPA